jgi:hypothetical protein
MTSELSGVMYLSESTMIGVCQVEHRMSQAVRTTPQKYDHKVAIGGAVTAHKTG